VLDHLLPDDWRDHPPEGNVWAGSTDAP
jgi:hypothetical protein